MRRRKQPYVGIGPPLGPVDYNRDLHECRECETLLQLGVHWRPVDKDGSPGEGRWWVVTRCRCGVYSTEAGAYRAQASAQRKRRALLAGTVGYDLEPQLPRQMVVAA